jgi:hypothetical protein
VFWFSVRIRQQYMYFLQVVGSRCWCGLTSCLFFCSLRGQLLVSLRESHDGSRSGRFANVAFGCGKGEKRQVISFHHFGVVCSLTAVEVV